MNIPLTPLRFLRYAEQQYPRRTAVVCNHDRFTYAEFADRTRRLAERCDRLVSARRPRRFLSTNCHRLLEAYITEFWGRRCSIALNIRVYPE
jgi:fatty-acyl-CoA synthase